VSGRRLEDGNVEVILVLVSGSSGSSGPHVPIGDPTNPGKENNVMGPAASRDSGQKLDCVIVEVAAVAPQELTALQVFSMQPEVITVPSMNPVAHTTSQCGTVVRLHGEESVEVDPFACSIFPWSSSVISERLSKRGFKAPVPVVPAIILSIILSRPAKRFAAELTEPQKRKQRPGREIPRPSPKPLVSASWLVTALEMMNGGIYILESLEKLHSCERRYPEAVVYSPDSLLSTALAAALAFAESAVLDEKALMALERLLYSATKELAVLIAASGDKVTTGTTLPPEFVVPVTVVTIGPSGPVVVISEVTIGGSGNCDEGKKSLLLGEVIGGTNEFVLCGYGGIDGYSMGGNPLRLVLSTGSQTTPPEPTTMVVLCPFVTVVTDVTAVTVVYWLSVVGAKVMCCVREPSDAVKVLTVLVIGSNGVGVGVGKLRVGVPPGTAVDVKEAVPG